RSRPGCRIRKTVSVVLQPGGWWRFTVPTQLRSSSRPCGNSGSFSCSIRSAQRSRQWTPCSHRKLSRQPVTRTRESVSWLCRPSECEVLVSELIPRDLSPSPRLKFVHLLAEVARQES